MCSEEFQIRVDLYNESSIMSNLYDKIITMPNIITINKSADWNRLLDVALWDYVVVVVVFVVFVNIGNCDSQSNVVVVGFAVVDDLAGAR